MRYAGARFTFIIGGVSSIWTECWALFYPIGWVIIRYGGEPGIYSNVISDGY